MLLHVYLNATCTEFCEKMLMCDFNNKKAPQIKIFCHTCFEFKFVSISMYEEVLSKVNVQTKTVI